MNIIVKLISGSHLYGTNIADSDRDYRGVYISTHAECYLGRVKDTVEDPAEEDTTYFSLQRFLDLACRGQSIAIEMLATEYPRLNLSYASHGWVWAKLRDNRKLFYTKKMHSFLGYAKSQSGKYSSRIDRLNEINVIIDSLSDHKSISRLSQIWDSLPESPNAIKTTNERSSNADKRVYQVCGRELQATVTVQHAYDVVSDIAAGYGERVRKAKDGQIEWKSLGHAFRASYQALEIAETGDLRFPLSRADWLRELRLGKIDFIKEGLDKKLDDLIVEVQEKLDKSGLPDEAPRAWCDQLILEAYDE